MGNGALPYEIAHTRSMCTLLCLWFFGKIRLWSMIL